MVIRVKKLHEDAKLPSYANPHDAGMDFFALETTTFEPGERKLVATGIAMAIPKGYVGLIWDKSGVATKRGVTTLAGVIDAGYRGEIKILMHNLSSQMHVFEKGTKVAQMLIQPVEQRQFCEVEELDETQRGEGGFGSSGLK